MRYNFIAATALLLIYLSFNGCTSKLKIKRELTAVEKISSVSTDRNYIKAHMKDGTVYVLRNWYINEQNNMLIGYGSHMNVNRKILTDYEPSKNLINIPISDISIAETNKLTKTVPTGLIILGGVVATVATICILDPKACFGSCPTFYAFDGDTINLMAEGFSSSVAPALEQRDIDMLYAAESQKQFELTVKNEALETHYIKQANILALEKNDNERIFVTPDGSFVRTSEILPSNNCQSPNGDCTNKIKEFDGDEYYSLSDSEDLNTKEEIYVSFNSKSASSIGLVIGKRQSLLTTFLLYQSLAYMGNTVGHWMAEMENEKIDLDNTVFSLLGSIEVFSKGTDGTWIFEGKVHETGPIATDFNIIPLKEKPKGPIELKLRLNKGLWRIDYLALASMNGELEPLEIEPKYIETISGEESNPHSKIINENDYLITYPGDEYKIIYDIPFNNMELFLDTKGYYLEWIRNEWLEEQNPRKVNLMFRNPSKYLKELTERYKNSEPLMEEIFWNSRYVKN